MSIFTKAFALASAERMVKTIAQAAGAIIVADGTGLLDTGWVGVVSASGMAGFLSLLASIGSNSVGEHGPSLATESTALADVDAEDDQYVGQHRAEPDTGSTGVLLLGAPDVQDESEPKP